MSDWRSRSQAAPVPAGDWRSRAKAAPVPESAQLSPEDEAEGFKLGSDGNLHRALTPLERALQGQTGDVVTVETPSGPVQVTREGRPVGGGVNGSGKIAQGETGKEAALRRVLATAAGGSLGLEAPISGAADWLNGGSFARGADEARSTTQQALDDSSLVFPLVGGVISAGLEAPASMAARLALGTGLGAVTGFNRSREGHGGAGALVGGAVGLGGGLVGEGLGAGLSKAASAIQRAPDAARQVSREQLIRAFNPGKRDIANLASAPPVNGKPMLDALPDEIMASGVVKPFQNADEFGQAVGDLASQRGKKIGEYLDLHEKMAPDGVVVPDVVADRIGTDVVQPFGKQAASISQDAAGLAQSEADLIRQMYGGGTLSLKEAEELLKRPHGDAAAKYARTVGTPPARVEASKGVYSAIKTANEEGGEAALRSSLQSSDPARAQLARQVDQMGSFKDLKTRYGLAEQAAQIAERNNPKGLANRALSPSDQGFGIATGQAYQPEALAAPTVETGLKSAFGYAGSIVHRAVRTRGNTTLAVAANAVEPALRGAANLTARAPNLAQHATAKAGATLSAAVRKTLKTPKDQADEEAVSAFLDQ